MPPAARERAFSFSCTIAFAVCCGTSAFASAVFSCSSETNGTPPASSVVACEAICEDTAGFCCRPPRSAGRERRRHERASERRADRIPRLVTVFWRPPTASLWASGTADTVTLPSCDASAPTPRPARIIGQVTTRRPPRIERRHEDHQPEEEDAEAHLADAAWRGVRVELRHTGGRDQERDRERQQAHPGFDRREPQRNGEKERGGEEEASLGEVLEEERGEPVAELLHTQDRRVHQRLLASRDQSRSQPRTGAARRRRQHQPDRRREADPFRRPGFGLMNPHVPARRIPYTMSARPSAESTVPTQSRRTLVSRGGFSRHAPRQSQDRPPRSGPRRRRRTAMRGSS